MVWLSTFELTTVYSYLQAMQALCPGQGRKHVKLVSPFEVEAQGDARGSCELRDAAATLQEVIQSLAKDQHLNQQKLRC